MESIPTKWGYLASRMRLEGLCDTAHIAEGIDTLLNRLEYKKTTPAWDEAFQSKELEDLSILDIMSSTSFCVPCCIHGHCDCCKFGMEGGKEMFSQAYKTVYLFTEYYGGQ